MSERRRRGTGGIEELPDGRCRVRAPGRGRRASLGTYATRAEAEAILAAALHELADVTGHDVTLGMWGRGVLDQRERDGLRAVREERNRWAIYVESDPISKLPIRTIDRRDVLRWLDGMRARRATIPGPKGERERTARKLSRQTVANALTLLRTVLEDASQRNVIGANPARDVDLPRDGGRTHDPWTYLTPEEQTRLVKAAGDDWPLVAFAIGTGLRQGEQWALRVEDVHVDGPSPRVVVRYGSAGAPTKSGRIRVVPLFGIGLDAAVAQLEQLGRLKPRSEPRSGDGLLFPSARGEHRKRGEPKAFEHARAAAALGRHVRWHDLRHTCASSLVAGWWGRAWSLEEVRAMLGHSTIQVTERYAHLAGTLVERAAEETRAASVRGDRSPRVSGAEAPKSLSHLRDLNSRPTVYEVGHDPSDIEGVGDLSPRERGYAALQAVLDGDPRAQRLLVDALVEALAAESDGHEVGGCGSPVRLCR